MATINSNLWKIAQLAGSSAYFQQMVRAACQVRGKTYSDRLLFAVASTPAIVTGLTVEAGGSIDVSLVEAMVSRGADLDKAILDAVAAYTAPTA